MTRTEAWLTGGLVLIATLLSCPAEAMSCFVMGLTDNVLISNNRGGRWRDHYESLDECEDLRVSVGRVHVMFETRAGIRNQDVDHDAYLIPSDVRQNPPDEPPSWRRLLGSIADIVSGADRARLGKVRSTGANPFDSALPRGKLAVGDHGLQIHLPLADDEMIESFDLRSAAGSVVIRAINRRVVDIPARKLKVGGTYTWTATIAGNSYRGDFTLVPPSEVAAAEQGLRQEEASQEGSDDLHAIRIAEGLEAADYRWRAREIAAAAFPMDSSATE